MKYLVLPAAPVLVGLVAIGVVRPTSSDRAAPVTAAEAVHATYVAGVDSFRAALHDLEQTPGARTAAAQDAFRRTRRAYKRIEYLATDLLPEAEITVNGPPLPRPHELVVDAAVPPTGLQVIEAALFPRPSPDADSLVRRQLRLIAPTVASLRAARVEPATADGRVFDAARLEIARVTTLGLAGFDATMTGDGIRESAEALRGVRDGLRAYRGPRAAEAWTDADRLFGLAIDDLDAHPDFDTFDRLGFIATRARPLARALTQLQAALAIPRHGRPTAWYARADAIYDQGAIDAFDYAPSDAAPLRPAVVSLGRRLFFDTRLSADGRRSCATCHQPTRAFTDGRRLPGVDRGHGVVRNTPTLLNASLQPFQFADQRARALEDQVAAVLANPREMRLPLDSATERLQRDSSLRVAFAEAYPGESGEAVSARRVQTALAAFVRSLVTVRSRFDLAIAGYTTALTGDERRGFTLFMGKAGCGTCHFAPTFGGSLPPALLESEPEVIGVPTRAVKARATVDPDLGVAGFDHAPIHRHAFKTPSLRNVALSAPYMHNGVYRTLDEVVDFYDRGGGAGIGIELPNQTLPPEPLHLTRSEKHALVAFMRALTDTVVVTPR